MDFLSFIDSRRNSELDTTPRNVGSTDNSSCFKPSMSPSEVADTISEQLVESIKNQVQAL